jgi:hypothetical protein
MGSSTQDDELDDLRANLAEDPDLADAFARLEAGKDSRRERRSGSEFGNPLKGFVPVESSPSASSGRAGRSGLPSFHEEDDAPPDTPTRRYVKSEHADPSLGEPPPSTHRNAAMEGRRGPLPKAAPPPRGSAPGAAASQRSKPNALVYGPVSSPNGAPSSPDPSMPVNSGPMISVRNTSISLPPEEVGSRVTPVVGAPLPPARPAYPGAPSSTPTIDPGFALQPPAESAVSEADPTLPEGDVRAEAPPLAAPALPADEREGLGARVWLLIAATLVSAAATVIVLMFVVQPLKPQGRSTAATDTATAPPQTTAPVAPAPTPVVTALAAPTPTQAPAATPAPPPTATEVAATPPTPTPGGAAAPTPVPGAPTFVPQFTKQPPGAAPPTARPPVTAKAPPPTTAAPKSTVSPIFEFER